MTEVTFWPIVASAFSSVVLAFIWYHPQLFGNAWMRMSNITPELAERGKKRMPLTVIFAFIASMLVAYVMSYFAIAWGVYDWVGALELGFWCWVGFTAPPMLGQVLWEQKPVKLYLINALYWLVTFMVMAVVLVIGSNIVVNGTPYAPDSASIDSSAQGE